MAAECSPRVRSVVEQIEGLGHEERALAAAAAQTLAVHGVYSAPKYVGSEWWVPRVEPDDGGSGGICGAVRFTLADGLSVAVAGQRVHFKLHSAVARCAVLALCWLAGWTLLSRGLFERGGFVFDPVLTIAMAAVVGSAVCRLLGIPAIVGCIWMGILWNNVPSVGYLTSGIVPEVRKVANNVGLAVILMRAGLSISVAQLRATALNTAAFALVPFTVEATLHAVVAKALFPHSSYTWAFLQGFIASPVAPGVVVPSVLALQAGGVAAESRAHTLLLSSVVEDMIAGIWGINFLVGLIFDADGDLGLAIALGPLQILAGIVLGVLQGAAFYHASVRLLEFETKFLHGGALNPDNEERASTVHAWLVLATALATLGAGLHWGVGGGAAFAVMVAAATCGHLWLRDGTEASKHRRLRMAGFFAAAWDTVVMPALFSMSGSAVVLKNIFAGDFFWRALVCLLVGVAGRLATAPLCMAGMRLSTGEKAYATLAWVGKGAAQGALGGLAFQRATEAAAAARDGGGGATQEQQQNLRSAAIVRDTAVLAILIGAPLSAVCMSKLGPWLLRK